MILGLLSLVNFKKIQIDEIPQFFNILKGDMAIIGPRPERPYFVKEIWCSCLSMTQTFLFLDGRCLSLQIGLALYKYGSPNLLALWAKMVVVT
jgi:hypothetical protein